MTASQLFDLGTFVAMVRRLGLDSEANPFVAGLIGGYGLPMAGIAKVALMALIVAVTVVLTSRSGRVERAAGLLVLGAAIVAGLVGGGSNVATMGGFVLAR